ncbi:MAG: hypothetical protein HOY69_30415 [Streptomyces sp.]|nr:hypothetical protein [Streptomyces sp.]
MSASDWQNTIGVVGAFALVGVIVWQLTATWRARGQLARQKEYRSIAERSVAAQESAERRLAEVATTLTDMRTRLTTLERVLKEVE